MEWQDGKPRTTRKSTRRRNQPKPRRYSALIGESGRLEVGKGGEEHDLWKHLPTMTGDSVTSRLATSTSMISLPRIGVGEDMYLLDPNYEIHHQDAPKRNPSMKRSTGSTNTLNLPEPFGYYSSDTSPDTMSSTINTFTLQVPQMGHRRNTMPSLFTEETRSLCGSERSLHIHPKSVSSEPPELRSTRSSTSRRGSAIEDIQRISKDSEKLYSEHKDSESLPVHTILVVGSAGVGKNSLVKEMLANGSNTDTFQRLSEVKRKKLKNYIIYEQIVRRTINRRILQFKVVRMENITEEPVPTELESMFFEASAVLYVYSITNRSSFVEVCQEYFEDCSECAKWMYSTWLIGAKCDLAKQTAVPEKDIDNQRKLFEKKFCKSSALVIDPDTGDSRAAQYKFRHMLTSTVYHQRTGQLFIEIVNTAINNQRIANVQKVQAATTQLAKRSMKYLTKMARKVHKVVRKMDDDESGVKGSRLQSNPSKKTLHHSAS